MPASRLQNQCLSHGWDISPGEARALQTELARKVICVDDLPPVRRIAGVDVGFGNNGAVTRAAVAVLDFPSLELRDYAIVRQPTRMPYIPGLLSFRECPAILEALDQLKVQPDLLLCDGQGRAHPRRLGVACHLGLLTGLPTIGVAKSRLCGHHESLPEARGSQVALFDKSVSQSDDDVLGVVLRSRERIRPLYVSVGHRISLETAVYYVQSALTKYRLPETTRWADALASNRGKAIERAEKLLGR